MAGRGFNYTRLPKDAPAMQKERLPVQSCGKWRVQVFLQLCIVCVMSIFLCSLGRKLNCVLFFFFFFNIGPETL